MLQAASACSRFWLRSHRVASQPPQHIRPLISPRRGCATRPIVMCSNGVAANGNEDQVRLLCSCMCPLPAVIITLPHEHAIMALHHYEVVRLHCACLPSRSCERCQGHWHRGIGAQLVDAPQSAATPPIYQPFRLSGEVAERDWVQHLELDTARAMADADASEPLKVKASSDFDW